MFTELKNAAKAVLPGWLKCALLYKRTRLHALLAYPVNKVRYYRAGSPQLPVDIEGDALIRRIFTYNTSLLPNKYIAELEAETIDTESATKKTGLSIGYPAWNLLYYSLLCSIPANGKQVVVVETGTNLGFSTIVLAQAIKDAGVRGLVHTVDINRDRVEVAKRNVQKAGLREYVKFNVADSLAFLSKLTREAKYINFAFLDGSHEYSHVIREFSMVYPKIVACRGKVYFDNTIGNTTGVARALYFIRHAYQGNTIEFRSCSSLPPGLVMLYGSPTGKKCEGSWPFFSSGPTNPPNFPDFTWL